MQYRVKETITDNGKVVSETVFTFPDETEMENGITQRQIEFNRKRFEATIGGNGIEFLNAEQTFTIL